MGCASSTPMIQTTGSEILKAATHVASDATKTAEDVVEDVKESVGKSLDTAKDSVETTVETVKQEVETVVKEKSGILINAKNSLLEKLHLKPTNNDNDVIDDSHATDANNKVADEHDMNKVEMNELKSQLNENSQNKVIMDATNTSGSSGGNCMEMTDIGEQILTRTDTETDSLKTSTPEPEIEQTLAKSHNNKMAIDDDDGNDDNPPTSKPTLSELENLTAEILEQQQQEEHEANITVNDILLTTNNDPLISALNDINNIKSITDKNMETEVTLKDSELKTATVVAATAIATIINNDNQPNSNMHKTPQILTAVEQEKPLTLATKTEEKENNPLLQLPPSPVSPMEPVTANKQPQIEKMKKSKSFKKEENQKASKVKQETEEKRPSTTEWEKFADMLALHRKFNPHDAFRRGQFRERASGQHTRGGMDDDSSDTTSNFRGSPTNTQRSSAKAEGRVQRLPNRPNTGNNRKKTQEMSSGGGRYKRKNAGNSNVGASSRRKFDFNPNRSRVNEFVSSVSSNPFLENSLQLPTVNTQMPYAPITTTIKTATISHPYESVKSPTNMRSHHSRSDTRQLPPLESLEWTRSHSQKEPISHQHISYNFSLAKDANSSSMPMQSAIPLTRESSNNSLFSNGSYTDKQSNVLKTSMLDLRSFTTNPPLKNTSSFLSTPRRLPYSIRKSYTDLYFSTTSNMSLETPQQIYNSKDKTPYKIYKRCDVCCKKYSIK